MNCHCGNDFFINKACICTPNSKTSKFDIKAACFMLQLTTILLHIIVMPINAKNLVYYKRLSILVPFFDIVIGESSIEYK